MSETGPFDKRAEEVRLLKRELDRLIALVETDPLTIQGRGKYRDLQIAVIGDYDEWETLIREFREFQRRWLELMS